MVKADAYSSQGFAAQAWVRLKRNRGAVVGGIIVSLFLLSALLAPWIAPYDPLRSDMVSAFTSPSRDNWLGTDFLGRDIFSRIVFGARISLLIGVVAVGIATIGGVSIGMVAGWYGGKWDYVLMRFMDLLLSFPGILLALVIVSILGPSLFNTMIAVGVSSVPRYARLVRGSVLATKENDYVDAARALGASGLRLMAWHIFPNILAPLLVMATLSVAGAILWAAALSFLGLGAQPPTPEWGAMLGAGRHYLSRAPWISTFPGIAIMITILGINLLGDGLRDALDPRQQR